MPRKKNAATPADNNRVSNGLASAVGFGGQGIGGGFNFSGLPYGQGNAYTEPTSDPATMFLNLRWFLVSNWRQFLSEAYVEIALVKKICKTPVDDALRGGITIRSQQLSPAQIEQLQISIDRDDDLTVMGDACIWNRLFGGAGILILTDQDPATPLVLSSIQKDEDLEFRAVDMWELFWDKQNTEGYDPAIQSQQFEYYNYYGEQVHKSRVMRLKGMTAPSFIRPRLRGWGFSVVEDLVRSINQYLKATDLGFQVLDEFKLDVYSIKGLTDTLMMGPEGENSVRQRIALANWLKNYQNALVMDSEDSYDHKQLSFSGLAEAMEGIRIQVASDTGMPMLKLFGTPSKGLNSSDEDSIEVYNAMVESQVRNKIKYPILRMLEVKCQKEFGMVPDDIAIEFKPLRVLSAEQEENVKTQKFTRLSAAKQTGEINDQEYRDACNKGNLFDIRLDSTSDALNPGDIEDDASDAGTDPNETTDVDDPGSNRADTRKSRATQIGDVSKEPPAPKSADAPEGKAEASSNGEGPRGVGGALDSPDEPGNVAVKVNAKLITHEALKKPRKPKRDEERGVRDPSLDRSESPEQRGNFTRTSQKKVKNSVFNAYTIPVFGKSFGFMILDMPNVWDLPTRLRRILANSAEYDRASYQADGGDDWIDSRRREFFENPGTVDEALWSKAKRASEDAFGEVRWQFVTWWYRKQGGKFS